MKKLCLGLALATAASGWAHGSDTKGPTPAQLAVQVVSQNDVADLAFSDYEYILSFRDASPENADAAAKVWSVIIARQKKAHLIAKVVSTDAGVIYAAVTEDNMESDTVDLDIRIKDPANAVLPQKGAKIWLTGTFTSYDPKPFRFHITDADWSNQSVNLPEKPPVDR